jgi:antitoxin component YwqK of YwqJK toxin-antitoxin module
MIIFKLYNQYACGILYFVKINESEAKFDSSAFGYDDKGTLIRNNLDFVDINRFQTITGHDVIKLIDYHIDSEGWFSGKLVFDEPGKSGFSLNFKNGRYEGISRGWFENRKCFYKIIHRSPIVVTKKYHETGILAYSSKYVQNCKGNEINIDIYTIQWDSNGKIFHYYKRTGLFEYRYYKKNGRLQCYSTCKFNDLSHDSVLHHHLLHHSLEKGYHGSDINPRRFCSVSKNGKLKFQMFSENDKVLVLAKSPFLRVIKIY